MIKDLESVIECDGRECVIECGVKVYDTVQWTPETPRRITGMKKTRFVKAKVYANHLNDVNFNFRTLQLSSDGKYGYSRVDGLWYKVIADKRNKKGMVK